MKIRRRKKKPLSIELAPLVDVVFLLLTFYMLTSTFNKKEGIQLELPSANSAVADKNNSIVVSLIDSEKVSIDNVEMPLAEVRSHLADLITPESNIFVRSNKDNQVQSLVTVIDEIRAAGGKSVTIATSRAK